jgi:hypothetical protein
VKAQAEVQAALQKRMSDLQMETIHQCAAPKNIPMSSGNGNVDCKPGPK